MSTEQVKETLKSDKVKRIAVQIGTMVLVGVTTQLIVGGLLGMQQEIADKITDAKIKNSVK